MSLSANEQYLLELINRARLDPLAEAERYGVDLNEGLDAGTISSDAKQILAPNDMLAQAADSHSSWMIQADTFSHTGSGDSSPGTRMESAGYDFTGSWTWRENLAWAGTTGTLDAEAAIEQHHEGLYLSSGHRTNTFAEDIREVGIAQVEGDFEYNGSVYESSLLTENFAASGSAVFVSGVAYQDFDRDGFYSIGEGQSGIWIATDESEDTTEAAGGYALSVDPSEAVSVTVGEGGQELAQLDLDMSDGNVKVDFVSDANGNRSLALSGSAEMTWGIGDATLLGVADLDLQGHSGANLLIGNLGDNVLDGRNGNDVLEGLSGADLLVGGAGFDVLKGGHDNDRLEGGLGDDQLYGGAGYDVLLGGTGTDILSGGKSGDTLYGGLGNDGMFGDAGWDVLHAGYGHDSLQGGNGSDRLFGGGGNDVMDGGYHHDIMYGGIGWDFMTGGFGNDMLDGGSGNDKIYGNIGMDLLRGGFGADVLRGGLGDDRLYGQAGNDQLYGEAGDDLLDGGYGDDLLVGGGGADTFVFVGGNDVIDDFTDDVDAITLREMTDLTISEVIDLGAIVDGNAVFNLGDNRSLTIMGVDDLDLLANDLTIL